MRQPIVPHSLGFHGPLYQPISTTRWIDLIGGCVDYFPYNLSSGRRLWALAAAQAAKELF